MPELLHYRFSHKHIIYSEFALKFSVSMHMQLSVVRGSKDIAKYLLKNGADPNLLVRKLTCQAAPPISPPGGYHPLAVVYAQGGSGLTALHLAAKEGHTGLIPLLQAHGTFINIMDATEDAYVSIQSCDYHVITGLSNDYLIFVSIGSDRLTPFDHAKKNGHSDCVDVIRGFHGVAVADIKEMAAISIQRAYRAYRLVHHPLLHLVT